MPTSPADTYVAKEGDAPSTTIDPAAQSTDSTSNLVRLLELIQARRQTQNPPLPQRNPLAPKMLPQGGIDPRGVPRMVGISQRPRASSSQPAPSQAPTPAMLAAQQYQRRFLAARALASLKQGRDPLLDAIQEQLQ